MRDVSEDEWNSAMDETGLVSEIGAEEAAYTGVEDGGDRVLELMMSADDDDIARATTLIRGDADVCTLIRACQFSFSYIHYKFV